MFVAIELEVARTWISVCPVAEGVARGGLGLGLGDLGPFIRQPKVGLGCMPHYPHDGNGWGMGGD